MTSLETALQERKAEARELEETAEQARALGSNIEDMKIDLQRAEARHAAFAAVGKERVEIPIKQFVPQFHCELAFEPLKSLLSGTELAAKVGEKITYLRAQIAEAERKIAELLAE